MVKAPDTSNYCVSVNKVPIGNEI